MQNKKKIILPKKNIPILGYNIKTLNLRMKKSQTLWCNNGNKFRHLELRQITNCTVMSERSEIIGKER